MKTCCFCWDVRSGTIASAVYILVTRTLVIILFSTILGLRQKDPYGYYINYEHLSHNYEVRNTYIPWYYQVDFSNKGIMISLGVCCFQLLFSAILLIGVKQKNRSLFLPWIILFGLEILTDLGFLILTFVMTSWDQGFPRIITTLIGIALQCYMLICVISYYRQLSVRQNNMYNIISLNSPNAPHEATDTTNLFYSNAGWYYKMPASFPNQLPKNENTATSFSTNPGIQG